MKQVRLLFVGGFLGSGKTTLLWRTAELLLKRGQRVGLITNDQAPDLVDTKWLAEQGLNVREVAGSCFCCNFAGLIYAAEKLLASGTDVLIGEPVGSCTDLSATILQPLKDRFRGQFTLAPLSVLADPPRLVDVLSGLGESLHPDVAYIFRKQLEEADLLVVNKTDLLSPDQRRHLEGLVTAQLPSTRLRFLSARTGQDVEPWLDEVLATHEAGTRIVDVDYDVYASGEAVLGWLNADIRLSSVSLPADWRTFCSDLLSRLQTQFHDRRARIGHVKLLLTSGRAHCIGNLTGQESPPVLQGQADGSTAEADLTLNARVEMPPEELERIVRATLARTAGPRVQIDIRRLQSLRPGRPQPTHRYDTVAS
jgi:Ni2+-binding GTPase involved in maturation of urease and hydrogenase